MKISIFVALNKLKNSALSTLKKNETKLKPTIHYFGGFIKQVVVVAGEVGLVDPSNPHSQHVEEKFSYFHHHPLLQ